jgi:hypothetical protein
VDGLLGEAATAIDARTAPLVLARLGAAHRRLRDLAALEAGWVAKVKRAAPRVTLVEVPRFPREVHDLAGLSLLHDNLFAGGEGAV